MKVKTTREAEIDGRTKDRRLVRRAVLAAAAFVVLLCIGFVSFSGATFTSGSTSNVRATTDQIQNWLHIYSESTDPDGLGSYYDNPRTGQPAATGTDTTASVTMDISWTWLWQATTCSRVLTIAAPSTLPTGTSCTVTASLVADPATGQQPITSIGFATVGSTTYTNPMTVNAGQKLQINMQVRPSAARTYHPTIVLTVTYSGYAGSYYQYSIPASITGSYF